MKIEKFKDYAAIEIDRLRTARPSITKEELIEAFPHKIQSNVFEMWKKQVNDYFKTIPTRLR